MTFLSQEPVLSFLKGRGKGKASSGKGFGRKRNPIGRDGNVMKCHTCGSEEHLQAKCPQNTQPPHLYAAVEGTIPEGGPLSEVLQPQFSFVATEATATTPTSSEVPTPAASDTWHAPGGNDPWAQARGDSASDSSWTNLPGRWVHSVGGRRSHWTWESTEPAQAQWDNYVPTTHDVQPSNNTDASNMLIHAEMLRLA